MRENVGIFKLKEEMFRIYNQQIFKRYCCKLSEYLFKWRVPWNYNVWPEITMIYLVEEITGLDRPDTWFASTEGFSGLHSSFYIGGETKKV